MPLVLTAVAESQYATTDTKNFQKKRTTYFDCRLFILYLQYEIEADYHTTDEPPRLKLAQHHTDLTVLSGTQLTDYH